MAGMRPLSQSVPGVADKLFSRKYTMLGRLVTNWSDIIGDEYAQKTAPIKLHYRKGKKDKNGGKPTASLDIAANTADSTVLHYRSDLILERINQIFGDCWITSIRFVPDERISVNAIPKKPKKDLTEQEQNTLAELLEQVEDAELKERLQNLGKAVLQEQRNK